MKSLKEKYITKNKSNRMHGLSVPIIGLTGGIATGKTTCSDILKKLGFSIICADQLIKTIYQEDETFNFIRSNYPAAIKNEQIDFKKLREIAFSNKKNKENLENFLYKKLPQTFFIEYEKLGSAQLVFYDVPLLFENKLELCLDQTITVYAPRNLQLQRLLERDKIDETLANQILNEQLDIEEKRKKANFVIENTTDISSLKLNINKLLKLIF